MISHPIEEANSINIFGDLSPQQFYVKHGVEHAEKLLTNSRGNRIFTQSWEPLHLPVKGMVLVLHGFTGDSSWSVQLTCIGIAERGFSVHALDHQGHGRSDGMRAHIPDINPVVDDCIQFAGLIRENLKDKVPCFIFGESLGGALAVLIHLRQPKAWDGLILNGAMCGISQKFKPPWPMEHLLGLAAAVIPTWPIVPTKDIGIVSFKEPWKLELVTNNPFKIALKPRPSTALEFLRVVAEIESRLNEVQAPFLIVHGELDLVCDPAGVTALYEKASSTDKTLKLYKGMWHQLVGEPKENLDVVFSDICSWLDGKAQKSELESTIVGLTTDPQR